MTSAFHRFIIVNSEGFKWFEATASGGQGRQRGAVAWADVRGAARVGEWNGYVAPTDVLATKLRVMFLADCKVLRCVTRVLRKT